MRLIRDSQRGLVLVYELEPEVVNAGPRTLVFESAQWSARLETYPNDWRRMTDEALLGLAPHTE
jgi:hypothetical protein